VRRRVTVQNPADGGFFYWLGKLFAFAYLCVVAILLGAAMAVYAFFARTTPIAPDLASYASVAPGVTRFYAGDGTLLAELADEWREVVPYSRIPPRLAEAFLSAEDHEFFSHGGIYFKGIARAAWRNLTSGEFAQGGSTITQQVAKQIFLSSEKTLARKVREAILARRLESRYAKEEILTVYLNHIFLGSGAYGVQAAAERYFGKDVGDLDLAEMAMIAGLARSPSRDSPLVSVENATRRRDTVLDSMAKYGYVSEAEAAAAKARPPSLRPYRDVFLTTSPYFAEHARRLVKDKYGQEALMKRGLRVETTVLPWVDGAAYENVDYSTRKQDKRQGWRGPEARLEGTARDTFVERQRKRYGAGPLTPGRRYLALVEEVANGGATVRVGDARYRLPLKNMSWAAKWSKNDSTNDQKITAATDALRAGDVVWIARQRSHVRKFSDWTYDERLNAYWTSEHDDKIPDGEVILEQAPRVQGAIYTMDHQTGYVEALVGGNDYLRSEFNRATQACRQPGSTYKPIYYSAALDAGYSFDTLLNDVPRAEVDATTGEAWVPVNLHGQVDYEVSLEYALVFSLNVPSVDLFGKVGAKAVEAWARRLGFTTPIIADKALALGASCVNIPEMSRSFAIFARNGRWVDPVYIRRVLDRDGKVLEDNTVWWDAMLSPGERLARMVATGGNEPKQAIPAKAAYLTTRLLREVVSDGYSGALRAIDVPAAGKTGTSSATMDLWFVAFTSRWLTTTWLGDDLRERPLGKDDAAYMMAVPVWARYMAEVSAGQPVKEIPWEVPPGVSPHDRGGTKGARSADGPMPLTPHKKVKMEKVPEGVRSRDRG
jgi:penicillin-binding protein 1A